MKLSFVIPALNEESCIGDCLKSVIREIHRFHLDAEIVVVDNGSTDRTGCIAAGFAGVRVVREPCRGLSAARHRGYLESKGEIIANLDADTRVPPGWAGKVIRSFDRDRRLACLSGPFMYYDLPQVKRIVVLFYYCFGVVSNLISQYIFKSGAMVQGGNFAVRRKAFDRIGGYNTAIEFYGEDADVATRLTRVGRVTFTLRLSMFSSARRLLKEGVVRTGYIYALNNIFRVFYGRLLTKTHTDIRIS
jgi:glycosyltransferase involved in cell wall biosynthesis